ncbi:hypothetical protein [Kitasatospora sp. NPDC059571]|uniref:hypothetical protein n=1 Tax=Kitasatospora sp. NPDC059571 TaxID=3346871 RepID=UPI0036B5FA46
MTALDQPASDRSSGGPDPAQGSDGDGAGERERQLRRVRRPTPSRRLRRLHPRQVPGQERPRSAPAADVDTVGEDGRVPLGVLIGGSPAGAAPIGFGAQRVEARLTRLGAGTSLVVLPTWREAIAVSVPTERLLASTGLRLDELPQARLTVVINPDALHDRDLGLHDWRAEGSGTHGAH